MNKQKNFSKVFAVFSGHYKLVPLEVFGKNSYKGKALASSAYKTLVSTVLSSRTRDETTLKVSKRLFARAPNIEKLKKFRTEEIEELIHPVGFYKTKAKHLHSLSRAIHKVPDTREELMKLPGVGRKTANLVLNRAFGIDAIAVDTHVHKISNMLSWVETKTPEQTEMELTKILPKKYWSDINRYFVSIGRQFNTTKKLLRFLAKKGLI